MAEHCFSHHSSSGRHLSDSVPKRSSFQPITFSGLICQLAVNIAIHAIQRFIMQRVKVLLNEEKTVSETVEVLDFDYPRHFSCQFKSYFGGSRKQSLQNDGILITSLIIHVYLFIKLPL